MAGWSEPMCLIGRDDEGKLTVNDETLAELAKVSGQLVVIGIVGESRSGKSFLMNLLAKTPTGSQICYSLTVTLSLLVLQSIIIVQFPFHI